MIIRTATKADAHEVSCLWEKMVNEMKPEWTPNRVWWEKMCVGLLETPMVKYTVVVAQDGGKIVGFIDGLLFPEPSTGKMHGTGQHFYILPEYRKRFLVAGRLYANILSVAIKGGAEVLDFFCFPEGIPFWNKRGYGVARCMMRREVAANV